MSKPPELKIDIFSHILPVKYKEALDKIVPGYAQQTLNNTIPTLWDLDHRFRIMDKYPGLMQVLTLSRPPIEEVLPDAKKALELTRMANDEMAELVYKYPDRFPAAVAAVSLTDLDGSLKELERTITELKFRGVQIYSHMAHKPLDAPEFRPLFEMMARFNLPIWIHPTTGVTYADYKTESVSKYGIANLLGWPYETSVAMTRLVYSGILEKWPNLKIITHHAGAMIPYLEQRIICFADDGEMSLRSKNRVGLTKTPIEYFKSFYADTAIYGNPQGLTLARSFFGIDRLLFGTDFPFAGHYGERVTRQAIDAIETMDISAAEKQKIFLTNARSVMRLPV